MNGTESLSKEKKPTIGGKKIRVSEIFGPTIQGEGALIGCATSFIRLAGCDYRCERCDSLHAVLPHLIKESATAMTPKDIETELRRVTKHVKLITLSGGNPCMWQNLNEFMEPMIDDGFIFALETQGTLIPEWLPLCKHVTISPKGPGMGEIFEPAKFKAFISTQTQGQIFCVKIVIFDQRDLEFAVALLDEYPFLRNGMWLSIGNPYPPEPALNNSNPPESLEEFRTTILEQYKLLLEDILPDPRLAGVRILPQLHTLLWGNEKGR